MLAEKPGGQCENSDFEYSDFEDSDFEESDFEETLPHQDAGSEQGEGQNKCFCMRVMKVLFNFFWKGTKWVPFVKVFLILCF